MTPKQRFQMRRQDLESGCEHPNPRFCRARTVQTNHGDQLVHYVKAWHVWDLQRNDYAYGTSAGEFDNAKDARDFRRTIIAAVEAGELK